MSSVSPITAHLIQLLTEISKSVQVHTDQSGRYKGIRLFTEEGDKDFNFQVKVEPMPYNLSQSISANMNDTGDLEGMRVYFDFKMGPNMRIKSVHDHRSGTARSLPQGLQDTYKKVLHEFATRVIPGLRRNEIPASLKRDRSEATAAASRYFAHHGILLQDLAPECHRFDLARQLYG